MTEREKQARAFVCVGLMPLCVSYALIFSLFIQERGPNISLVTISWIALLAVCSIMVVVWCAHYLCEKMSRCFLRYPTLRQVWIFLVVPTGLVVVYLLVLAWFSLVLIAVDSVDADSFFWGRLGKGLSAIGLLTIMAAGMFVAAYLCERTRRWFVILYVACVLLAVPVCIMYSTSQACRGEKPYFKVPILWLIVSQTPVMLAFAQIGILPWIGMMYLMYRKRLMLPKP